MSSAAGEPGRTPVTFYHRRQSMAGRATDMVRIRLKNFSYGCRKHVIAYRGDR